MILQPMHETHNTPTPVGPARHPHHHHKPVHHKPKHEPHHRAPHHQPAKHHPHHDHRHHKSAGRDSIEAMGSVAALLWFVAPAAC